MIATYLRPCLHDISGGRSRYRRLLKIAGLTESGVDEKLKPCYYAHAGEVPTILASGHIEVHLQADGAESNARAAIASRAQELVSIFADRIFGYDPARLTSPYTKCTLCV